MLAERINKARQAGFSDDEIVSVLGEGDPSLAGKIDAARQQGFSIAEIVTELSGGPKERTSPFDPSYLAKQFTSGLMGTVSGKGQTLQVLGADGLGRTVEDLGRSFTPDVQSASDRAKNPRAGDASIGGVGVGSLPGVVAEGLGSFVGELPSRAAGSAIGGVLGGIAGSVVPGAGTAAGAAAGSAIGGYVGPFVSTALSTFGPEVKQRQQNNEGELSGKDYAYATGSTALQSALNAVGMGGVLGKAGKALGPTTAKGTAVASGKAAGVEGATEGVQNVVSDVATAIDTKTGEINPGDLARSAVVGTVGGAGAGGLVRAAGDGMRKAGDAIGNRGYTHVDELPNVAADLNAISQSEKLTLGNRYDSAKAVQKYEAQIDESSKLANQAVRSRLKELFSQGEITQDELNKGVSALKQPTEDGFEVIKKYVGNVSEGLDAIQLAKKRVTLNELKTRAGLDSNPNKVTGGLTGIAERMVRTAAGRVLGGGLGVGVGYAGYQGLGTIGSTVQAVSHAAPVAGLIAGAALAPRMIDKALGTYDPVQNLVQNRSNPDGQGTRAGEGLPSLAQEKFRVQQEAARLAQIKRTSELMRSSEALAQRQENAAERERLAQERAQARSVDQMIKDAKFLSGLRQRMEKQETNEAKKAQNQQFNDIRYLSGLMAKSEANEAAAKKTQEAQTSRDLNERLRSIMNTSRLMQNSERLAQAQDRAAAKDAQAASDQQFANIRQTANLMRNSERQATTERDSNRGSIGYIGRLMRADEQRQLKEAKDEAKRLAKEAKAAEGDAKRQKREELKQKKAEIAQLEKAAKEAEKAEASTDQQAASDGAIRPSGDQPDAGAPAETPRSRPTDEPNVANTSLVQAVRNATKFIENTKNRKAIRAELEKLPTLRKREEADALVSGVLERFPRYAERIKATLDSENFPSILDKQFRDSKTGKYEYDGPSDGKDAVYAKPEYNGAADRKQKVLQTAINKALEPLEGFDRTEAQKLLDGMKSFSGREGRRAIVVELKKNFPEHADHFDAVLLPAINASAKYARENSADKSKRRKRVED